MRVEFKVDNRHHLLGKKSPHWGILLTLDDLPKINGNYRRLIVQLKARAIKLPKNWEVINPSRKPKVFSFRSRLWDVRE